MLGISSLAPNSLTQYTHRAIAANFFSLARSRGSAERPVCSTRVPKLQRITPRKSRSVYRRLGWVNP
jgi:hypothetical protein